MRGIEGDPNAIGYFGFAYYQAEGERLRAVPIDGGDGAVLPGGEQDARAGGVGRGGHRRGAGGPRRRLLPASHRLALGPPRRRGRAGRSLAPRLGLAAALLARPVVLAPRLVDAALVKEPRLWLLGYGEWTGEASATILGVGRYARSAVAEIADVLRAAP